MDLLEKVLSRENLKTAYRNVVRNKGTSGTDGIRTEDLKSWLVEHWPEMREKLVNGHYQPKAILGIFIPKRSGGERLLGIPTTFDRMLQQAIHQVLSPMFDPGFSEYSYGFRPGRSATGAILQATQLRVHGICI
jgi:RNA-directed DNA polymerase